MLAELITEHLLSSKLIPMLLKAQICEDTTLATKMTMRDVTLFVQVPRELLNSPKYQHSGEVPLEEDGISEASRQNGLPVSLTANQRSASEDGGRQIRIVIADLDEKSESQRGEYWRGLEQQLIQGEYYLGKGKLDANYEDCDLSDVAWTCEQVAAKWNHVQWDKNGCNGC